MPTADHRVFMHVGWDGYEALLALRGERPQPRMAYLDGVVELMTTSWDHERIKSWIGRIIEAYMLEVGILFGTYGHWTMKQGPGPEAAGVEADDCYQLGPDQSKRWPDLAIEVVWTHGGIDKLEIYRRLGVREVWFWDDGEIHVHVLGDDGYHAAERSQCLPEIDLELVASLVDQPTINDAVRVLRESLKRPGERSS